MIACNHYCMVNVHSSSTYFHGYFFAFLIYKLQTFVAPNYLKLIVLTDITSNSHVASTVVINGRMKIGIICFTITIPKPPVPLTTTSGCPVVKTLTPGLSPSSLVLRPGNEASLCCKILRHGQTLVGDFA